MEKTITISVEDKIAVKTNDVNYICGNSDFVIEFDFDEEWSAHEYKTARFTHNGAYSDVIFRGSRCAVPIMSNVLTFGVGVFAGNLQTTTPAFIDAKKSILCSGGVPAAPSDDVYNQIMETLGGMKTAANAVSYDKQALTDEQQTQARENIGALGEADLPEAVNTALAQAKASGEFDGADGKDGKDGQDGKNGADGKTPVKGTDYFTDADKQELVAELAENAIPVPATAEVGQTIVVSAVDENGKPTAWDVADMASGGGGSDNAENWRLVRKIILSENVQEIEITEDDNGKPFALKKIRLYGNTQGTATGGQLRVNVSKDNDDKHSILGPYYSFRGLDTTKRMWAATAYCGGFDGSAYRWGEYYNTPDTTSVGVQYERAPWRTPVANTGRYLSDRVEYLRIFSHTAGVEFASGSEIQLWGVDA